MKKLLQQTLALTLAMGILASGMPPETALAKEGKEKPILTIACLSDLHNQMSLIEGPAENVRLRGVVKNTLETIKKEEDIDMMILCGDNTSDSTDIPKENWEKVRELITASAKDVFPDPGHTPILWVTGNHEYEITREYNAGDYYTYPMKDDVGELPEEDSFYEMTYDDEFNLLAAYYYELYGFDFLCLNTGNFTYTYPDGAGEGDKEYCNYRYSLESVEWIGRKLEEIYENDPNREKTVFFVSHVPFNDSNSINKGKGLDESDAATVLLKKTLAKYPNLIQLYGHDHGGNAAFIREETAQRVTQYDIEGNKITDEVYSPLWQVEKVNGGYTVQNEKDGKYLGYADNNLMLSDELKICQIEQAEGGYYITTDNTQRPYVYFSPTSRTFSANKDACVLKLLEHTGGEDGRHSFTEADGVIGDGLYAFAKTDGSHVYFMTDQSNGSHGIDLRMLSAMAGEDDAGNLFYQEIIQKSPGFTSSFVGSMRYYANDINYPSSPDDSDIVQALMVYVYKDRIELHMKNYGKYDYYDVSHVFKTQPILIKKEPEPYYIYRKVKNNYAYTVDLEALLKQLEALPLEGYTAESVRAFTEQLGVVKRALKYPEGLTQSMVDYYIRRLNSVKAGLTLAAQITQPQNPAPPAVQPQVKAPKLSKLVLKASAKKNGKVTLSWRKRGGENGFELQMKKNKGKFKRLARITNKLGAKTAAVKKTTKKLAKGTYKFKVRSYAAYQDAAGTKKTVYSPYSKIVTVKIKK